MSDDFWDGLTDGVEPKPQEEAPAPVSQNQEVEVQKPAPQYQQPVNPAPASGPAPSTYPGKGLSVASLVLGIIAMVLLFTGWFTIISVVLGVVGLALGISGKKKTPNGMATAGIVLSIIALSLGALIFVSCVVCTACIVNSAVEYGPGWSDIFKEAENWNYTL